MKITLFDRLSECERLNALVSKLPEVRYDRVDEIKALISKGSYSIEPYQIVDKIIHEGIYILKNIKKTKTILCRKSMNSGGGKIGFRDY